ncbi:hypothetical protein G4L39_11110 [Limisphaera ngatamarikiensis]|uniref:Uncharacterized protein n=1 Tax=Limisphaera ngatamarikiensis TaxID=1324935 RepID=A0A6M1RX79_9BACT|nr:hypothetical protein [Limisphaera ngatamarikiensis]NGO39934.1 hypothetical protein [Limisphaera ngatamarikiensis]
MRQPTLQTVFGILKNVRRSGQVPFAGTQELSWQRTPVLSDCNLKRLYRQGVELKRMLAR